MKEEIIEEKNNKEDVRNLARPLIKWFLILLIPSPVVVYFFVDNRLGLAIFLGILFSAFGSVLLVATFLYKKSL